MGRMIRFATRSTTRSVCCWSRSCKFRQAPFTLRYLALVSPFRFHRLRRPPQAGEVTGSTSSECIICAGSILGQHSLHDLPRNEVVLFF